MHRTNEQGEGAVVEGFRMRSWGFILIILATGCNQKSLPPSRPQNTLLEFTVEQQIERAKKRNYWPDKETPWARPAKAEREKLLSKPDCKLFDEFVMPPKAGPETLYTDGVMVVKNGIVWYDRYDPTYDADRTKLHPMWSASKSFTAGIMAAIAQLSERKSRGEDLKYAHLTNKGRVLGLSTTWEEMSDERLNEDPRFGKITVEQFLAMAPNLEWKESYEANTKLSSIVHMLWLDGYPDMSGFAAKQKFGPEGMGNKFIYSSGNAVILMRALKAIYGAAYDRMPWEVLFDRIGMKKVVFERDRKDVFVGSSYLHMSLEDMAKFGYLYLNGGYYKKEQILHPDFLKKATELSIGMRADGTKDSDIEEEKSFYGMGFWINPDPLVLQAKGIRKFGSEFRRTKFFPKSPSDVYFAAGHYGQFIIVFPRQDVLLVRMGHDKEYFSKLDRLMQLTLACFAPGEG